MAGLIPPLVWVLSDRRVLCSYSRHRVRCTGVPPPHVLHPELVSSSISAAADRPQAFLPASVEGELFPPCTGFKQQQKHFGRSFPQGQGQLSTRS